MQLLPISDAFQGNADKVNSSFIKSQGSDFADVFAEQVSTQSDVDAVVASNKPAVSEDFNLSREDVLGLTNELSEQGISDDRLGRLKELVNSDEPVTPRSVAEALRKTEHTDIDGKPAHALSDGDRQELNMFLRKLGFNEDEAASAVAHLEGGGDLKVWMAMAQRLAMMDPAETIDVSASEIDVLSRAFRLNADQRDALNKLFAGEDKQLSAKDLKTGLLTLSQEMGKRAESDAKLNQALEDSLGKIRQAILDRQKIEQAADSRGSKEALQKEALYKDAATAKADGMAPAPAKGNDKDGVKDYAQSVVQKASDAAKEAALRDNGQADKIQGQQQAQNGRDIMDHDFDPRQQGRNHNSQGKDSDNAGRWMANVRSDDKQGLNASTTESLLSRNDFIAHMNFNQSAQNAAAQSQARQNAGFAQQVFQQVESGMLRNLADGTKQLTIQLTPENLGTVSVLLSMKNKELTAILRPENPEAAKAIEDQLHTLRLTLEQQGLKVERLEVRPQLQDSTQQAWQGFEQNQGQEAQHKSKEEQLADLFRGRPMDLEDDNDVNTTAMPSRLGEHSTGLDLVA